MWQRIPSTASPYLAEEFSYGFEAVIRNPLRLRKASEEKLLKQPGVTGVDVGYKICRRPADRRSRHPRDGAREKESRPEKEMVPATVDGVKTTSIERTFFLHDAKEHQASRELELSSTLAATTR